MKNQLVIGLGMALALLGLLLGRLSVRSIPLVNSPEALQALIIGCAITGVVLVVVGIVGQTLR